MASPLVSTRLVSFRRCDERCMQQATCNIQPAKPHLKTHNIVHFMNNYYISFISCASAGDEEGSRTPLESLINLWFFCIPRSWSCRPDN